MKKIILLALCLLSLTEIFSQGKNPRIMVIPMDVWCNKNGFSEQVDNMGTTETVPNYKAAVQNSSELMGVISKINTLFSERGFPLADLSQSIKNIERRNAEANLIQSKTSGSKIGSNALDDLNKQARADIYVEIDWDIHKTGPKRSVTFNLRGIDAYTGKQVAGEPGSGAPSFVTEVPVLLEEAILSKMDRFLSQLQEHFEDMITNGREISLELNVFDNGSGLDLEKEYKGKELREIIEDWMADNTVNHRFNTSENTENMMLFDDVRIPLLKSNGRPQDASGFANDLIKFLKAEPFNITCKNTNPSLGKARIILGEK